MSDIKNKEEFKNIIDEAYESFNNWVYEQVKEILEKETARFNDFNCKTRAWIKSCN